ncbi:unnamed protein product [Toxocara canis]|uniref:Uncharacterized protein n=1 Tax=Toxocara canis TaxID=6265 RepID=A0A183UZP5_TOXCA|nr:unnamed protein product [Toxocara canis]
MIKVEDANDAVFIAKLARAFVEVKHKKQDKVCTLLGVVRSLGKTTWTDFSATKYLERFPAGNEICLGADGPKFLSEGISTSSTLPRVHLEMSVFVVEDFIEVTDHLRRESSKLQRLKNKTLERLNRSKKFSRRRLVFALPRTETVTKHLRTSSTIGGPDNISETGKESTVVTSSTASNERLWIKQSTSVPLSEMQSTPPTTETLTTLSTTSSKSTTPFEMGKESTSLPQSTTFNERLPIASTLSKTIITHETDIELTSGHFNPSARADFISSRVTDKRPSSPQLEEEDEDEQKGKRLVAIMIVFLLVFEAGSLISAVLTYNNVI